jgi:hypothetical protein
MPTQKIRYTLWVDEDVLRAAKVRSAEEGVTASRIIVAAARSALINAPQNAETRILQSVERVLVLLQRIDRRRGYDHQVLKEMVGLMVQSFFNHTPAIPEKDKKAALHSGKARFNRFLDALAGNLRGGQSILNDLPAPAEPAISQIAPADEGVRQKVDSSANANLPPAVEAVHGSEAPAIAPEKRIPQSKVSLPGEPRHKQTVPTSTKRWSLFG